MANDDFAEAARAEAERYVPAFTSNDYTPNGLTAIARLAHVEGWKAARTYLAAQEPTDAEVAALIDSLAEQAGVFIMPLTASMALQDSRRASRRDEEKR